MDDGKDLASLTRVVSRSFAGVPVTFTRARRMENRAGRFGLALPRRSSSSSSSMTRDGVSRESRAPPSDGRHDVDPPKHRMSEDKRFCVLNVKVTSMFCSSWFYERQV